MDEDTLNRMVKEAQESNYQSPFDKDPRLVIILVAAVSVVLFIGVLGMQRIEKDRAWRTSTTKTTTLSLEEEERRMEEAARREERIIDPRSVSNYASTATSYVNTTQVTTTTTKKEERPRLTKEQILANLKKEGFKEVDAKKYCGRVLEGAFCLAKGDLTAELSNSDHIFFYFSKNISEIKASKIKDTIKMIGRVYNRNIYDTTLNAADKFVTNKKKLATTDVQIHQDELRLVLYDFSRCEISSTYFLEPDDNLQIEEIATILDRKDVYTMKSLTEMFMESNKKMIRFYDYVYLHINDFTDSVCAIHMNNTNGYILKSDFCHGGTSDFYYEIDKNSYKNNNVYLSLVGTYFEKNYKKYLNTDMEYFNKKLNTNFKISQDSFDLIANLIKESSTETKERNIVIDDKLSIHIKHEPNTYDKPYKITYVFNNI